MAIAVRQADGTLADPDKLQTELKTQLDQAWAYRKQFEPIWLSNLAFGKGQHWLVWDDDTKKMRHLTEMDPRYEDRELVTIDKINEHFRAQLGELESDDDRPELLLAQEGDTAEAIQRELNDLVGHGWEHEWGADQALKQMRILCLTMGVAAIRIRTEPTRDIAGYLTLDQQGQKVTDPAALAQLQQTGQLPDGSLPTMQPVYERKTIWEPLSAFNLLTPAGISHEDWFPWEAVVRPVLTEEMLDLYPAAAGLVEDDDIASLIGITTGQAGQAGGKEASQKGRLRGHSWLFTVYRRPCAAYPDGQTCVLGSKTIRLLDAKPELEYKTVKGDHTSGIHYFHWWRNADTFMSRAMIEPLKDPQRIINRRETQKSEIIDRGMPKTFVKEGTLVHNPAGLPLEVIELKADANEPNFFAGIGPGDWINEDLAHQADNLAHASTLSPLRLGENPPNVMTLGQLTLLNENEATKRSTILQEHKAAIARCVEDSVEDVRRYWPDEKQILVSGDEDAIAQQTFSKSKIPDFYVVRPAKGAAKPRSQGAELTKVDAIWNAALACGVAVNPQTASKWIDWYAKSLDAGQALELPEEPSDAQVDWARFENFLMLDQEEDVQPADYDLLPVHVPIHREAQNQARASGDQAAYQRIEAHIQASIQLTQLNALKVAAAQQVPSPAAPPAQRAPVSLSSPPSLITGQPSGVSAVTGGPAATPPVFLEPPAAADTGAPLPPSAV